jgi:hypothetical protein
MWGCWRSVFASYMARRETGRITTQVNPGAPTCSDVTSSTAVRRSGRSRARRWHAVRAIAPDPTSVEWLMLRPAPARDIAPTPTAPGSLGCNGSM